jgi:uncharacterized protein YndB with AHSA1/START domain
MTDLTGTTDRQAVVTRVFDAPREDVFRAWTQPAEVAAWFGPDHMVAPRDRIRIDLRVGGRYEVTMVGRDGGGELTIGYEIVELDPPALLVLRSDPMPEMGMDEPTVVRVELHEEGAGRTRMVLTDGPLPVADRAEAGWRAACEKLAAYIGR